MRAWRGLTLVELIVTISLILLGLSAVFVNIHRRPTQGAGELANIIVAKLREVRARAKGTGSPRAFCIPTDNAVTPCAQSFYEMGGHGKTAPRVVVDTSRQFPGLYLFVGLWSSAPQSITSPGGSAPPLLVANWMNPPVRDFVFLFNRDGRLATNDLPHDDKGNSYIIVSDGIEFANGTAPPGTATVAGNPPPYCNLTRVNKPWVIRISPSGIISKGSLMTNPATGLVITQDQPGPPTVPAAAPAVKPTGNVPPIITKLDSQPKATAIYNPPFETTISPEGRVSMALMAYDPDGEDLKYEFKSTPSTGKFTYPNALRWLSYPDPYANLGEARIDWVPPYDVITGSTFQLDATVTDENGNSVTNSANVTVDVKVVQDGLIAFDSGGNIGTMRGDGTSRRIVSYGSDSWPELSPNGQNIVFVSTNSVTYTTANGTLTQSVPRIWLMSADGSGARRLSGLDTTNNSTVAATVNTTDSFPCWSPDGTKILFARDNGGVSQLQIIKTDGSWVKKNLAVGTKPNWSYTPPTTTGGKDIIFENAGNLTLASAAGSLTTLPISNATDPVWHPDGTYFVYVDTAGNLLKEALANGSSAITKSSTQTTRVDFSAGGTRFVGASGSQATFFIDPGQGTPATNSTSVNGTGPYNHMSWETVR